MSEFIFYFLGLVTGWLIFWKFPVAYELIKDIAAVAWSWIKGVFDKFSKKG